MTQPMGGYDDYLLDDSDAPEGGYGGAGQFVGGSKFPFLQWMEQNPNNRHMPNGGFFWTADNFPASVQAPWQVVDVYFAGSNAAKWGYVFPTLECIILAQRQDWGHAFQDGKKRVVSGNYDIAKASLPAGASMKSRVRYLVLVKGVESVGPVMLTIWGTKGNKLQQAISTWFRDIHAAGSAKLGERNGKVNLELPPFAAYVPIIAGPQEKANPRFASMITPPVLPPQLLAMTRDQKADYFIANLAPREVVAIAKSHWNEARSWATAELTGGGEPEGFQAQPNQAPPPTQGWGNQPPAQQPYGQPAYGQPAYGQPPYQPPAAPPPAAPPMQAPPQWGGQPQWGQQPTQQPPAPPPAAPPQWGQQPPAMPPQQGGGPNSPQPFQQGQNGQPLSTPPWK